MRNPIMETPASGKVIKTRCCIVGGGPAGVMLGYLLARAGIEVLVLEKHGDFFRDFRGDTIHPSTLELMKELGILDEFLKLPHQKVGKMLLSFEGETVVGPDFTHLPVTCPYIAFMPQWDFLNFLSARAKQFPSFHLRMKTEVTGVIEEGGRVVGVRAKTDDGEIEIRADLVFGTDGRHSTVRQGVGSELEDYGVPIDVLWFRISKPEDKFSHFLGRIVNGQALVTLDRGDYYQAGAIIPKGAFEHIKKEGLEAFQQKIATIVPSLKDTVKELDNWDKIKLLTVQINRLHRWYKPGLLCIGDAAHAMSPAGGVGVNLAIQDAVAAANLLAEKILNNTLVTEDFGLVQHRREWPVKMTQKIQAFMHRNMFRKNTGTTNRVVIPLPVRKIMALFAPVLRRLGARIIGIGFRAEHIHSPERKTAL